MMKQSGMDISAEQATQMKSQVRWTLHVRELRTSCKCAVPAAPDLALSPCRWSG